MTNNEIRARLLIEAAGLLEEGAQADAYKNKKRKERLSKYNDDKQRRMNVEYSKDGLSKVYHAQTGNIMDYDSKEGRIITKAEKNGLSRNDAIKHDQKMKDIAHKASEITRKEAARRDQIAKASGKVYDEDFDSDYMTAMDATNRHIRRHDRLKAQNESVENLLNECYELLEESYGKHGAAEKLAKVRYDNLKSKIDKETAAGRKVDPFHMELTKIGLDREKKFNKDIDTEGANHKDDKSFDSAQLKAKKDDNYDRMLQRTGNFQCLYPWNSVKNYRLHGKINNKAKSQNESAYDIDIDDLMID